MKGVIERKRKKENGYNREDSLFSGSTVFCLFQIYQRETRRKRRKRERETRKKLVKVEGTKTGLEGEGGGGEKESCTNDEMAWGKEREKKEKYEYAKEFTKLGYKLADFE